MPPIKQFQPHCDKKFYVTTNKNTFQAQDRVLLIDRKGRRYLKTLEVEQVFHSHVGRLYYDQLIGESVGGWYRTDKGHVLLAVRPTFGDSVTAMPRGPQIIYPKDLGNIVTFADIFPGATVVEGGLGSGALTSALLRAVGPNGRVITYEIDEKVLPKAQRNIQSLVQDPFDLTITVGDIYQGISERDIDRVVLDVPEPWQAVSTIGDALSMGGMMLSFLPTILQVHQLVTALEEDGRFQLIDSFETLLRPWHLKDRSVRPVHRMIAHSGFLTTAVRCQPRAVSPAREAVPADETALEDPETGASEG